MKPPSKSMETPKKLVGSPMEIHGIMELQRNSVEPPTKLHEYSLEHPWNVTEQAHGKVAVESIGLRNNKISAHFGIAKAMPLLVS